LSAVDARAAAVRSRARRPARRRSARRRYALVLLFMSPWIIGFSAFIAYPMISSLYFSFTRYDLLSQPEPIGVANYAFMFTSDPRFWLAMRNTLWIIGVGVPLRIILGIVTAMLLTRPRKGIKVYRTIYFLPSMAPHVAAALAFIYVLHPSYGPVNQALVGLGIRNPPLWFYGPGTSKWALVILGLWGIGDAMIIFLAGLLDVPKQLYEAADIEGASAWQKFRYVTLPFISPVIFFSLIIGVINGFQYFTQAYVASTIVSGTRTPAQELGYPEGSLLFFSPYLFQIGFYYFRMGYASAIAWVLLAITLACTAIILRTSRRWVHYGGALR
jgi:multiple sugar transport system permease protein